MNPFFFIRGRRCQSDPNTTPYHPGEKADEILGIHVQLHQHGGCAEGAGAD